MQLIVVDSMQFSVIYTANIRHQVSPEICDKKQEYLYMEVEPH